MTQSQKAGPGSKQIQVYGDYYEGVTEERAAEIARQQAQEVIATYSLDAAPVARQRVEDFSSQLIEVLSHEHVLGALSDPGFQISLRRAQMSAAATEEEADYQVLARLLGERAKRNIRPIRASIDRAIEIIDSLDDSALQGLTMAWVVGRFPVSTGRIGKGLDHMERMWKSLPQDNLPQGGWWLDHLDMLNLARHRGLASPEKLNDVLQSQAPGFFTPGLEQRDIALFNSAADEIKERIYFEFIKHELKKFYYRLPFCSVTALEVRLVDTTCSIDQRQALLKLAEDMGRLGQVDPSVVAVMDAEIAKREGMAFVKNWYDQIPHAVQFTGAGVAVAFVNAQKHGAPLGTDSLEDLLPK